MTEQWLLSEINKLIQNRKRVVLLDPIGRCNFVLSILKEKEINILQTDSSLQERWKQEKEELLLRHRAETVLKTSQWCFMLPDPPPQENQSCLFDYCFTPGFLYLSHSQD